MLLVHQIRLDLRHSPDEAIAAALAMLKPPQNMVLSANLHKLSVDARRGAPKLVASVAVTLADSALEAEVARNCPSARLAQTEPFALTPGGEPLPGPVVVCGLGPAGLFAALELAEAGYRPLVLERGPDMDARRLAVNAFESGGVLDPDANIQFGEGGAGTFSDGKLTTRIGDALCGRVISRLLDAGAPPEIAWRAKPHVGTDLLQNVLRTLRQRLCELGGEVRFRTRLTGFTVRHGRLVGVETSEGALPCGALLLAVGHSARDTFAALRDTNIPLTAKPFSIGFRAEHLQADIDKGLYHEAAGHPALPPGEYQLNTKVDGRGVYTFCMCPGGSVVAAQSEPGTVVTNGMSLHARAGSNANAAVVVGVHGEDFGGDPFAAIAFQQELERAAYAAGGGQYAAPAETLGSFLEGKGKLELGRVKPTYPRGVAPADLGALLPPPLTNALRGGLRLFGRKLPGYAVPDAVLTGLETRTSSPVRIPRNPRFESETLPGLWPCGEGAGYAGGIMSAAVDGIRTASAVIGRYTAPD